MLIASPSGVSLFAPTAQTVIVNDQPVPGNPAEPAFFEVSGAGTLQKNGANYVLNLGNVVEGQSASVQLGVSNNAAAPADNLAGAITYSGTGGFSAAGGGSLAALAPGGKYVGLYVQVGTAAPGEQSETITLYPLDQNETGYTGSLAPATITIEDNVLAPAAAVLAAGPVNLGTVRAGAAPSGTPYAPLSIENAAATGAASLDAWVAGASSGLTASGAITGLAPGHSSPNIVVGLDTSAGGAKSGDVSIAFQSDAGGGQTASLPNQKVSVSGTVYEEAAISVAPLHAAVHVNDPTSVSLVVTNTGAANGYSEGAVVSEADATGGLKAVAGTTGTILAGRRSTALEVQLPSTATAGRYSGQVLLDLKTEGGSVVDGQGAVSSDGFGETDLGTNAYGVTIDVYNHASAAFEKTSGVGALTQTGANAYTLDLGAHAEGSGYVTTGFGVINTALASAFSDWLSGNFLVSGNADGAFANASFAEFGNLSGGSADTAPQVALSTDAAGHFSETIKLTLTGSNSSGFSEGLEPETLTIEGDVLPVTITPRTKTVDLNANGGIVSETLDIVDNALAGGPITATIVGFDGAVTGASDASVALSQGDEDDSTLSVSFSTATSGVKAGTVSVALSQDGASLGTVTVPVSLTVDNPAVARIQKHDGVGVLTRTGDDTYTLDLGSTTQGSSALLASLDVLNAAAVPSDLLNGSFTGPSGDLAEYANGGFGKFSGYSAGAATGLDQVELTTYKVGTFTETFTLHPNETLSDGTTAALPDQTVTVTGAILPKVYVAPPTPVGVSWGDVHLTTFDGLMYDFQAAGEFTLAKSTVAGDDFSVQIRIEPWSPGASVSVTTQVAVGFGSERATFGLGRTDNTVWVDGHASTLSMSNPTIALGDGAAITELSSNAWRVNWSTGEALNVTANGTYFSVSAALGPSDGPGSVKGLLGSDSGQANDFQLADGAVIPQPIAVTKLYGEFADAWRVSDRPSGGNSLFDYPAGQGTAAFTDKNFPADYNTLSNLPANLLAEAQKLVAQAGITDPGLQQAAELDFLVTGDPNAITQSQNAQEQGVTTTQAGVYSPALSTQLGVAANALSEAAATTGPTAVTFTAYLTQAAAADTTVSWTVVAPDSTDFGASAFGGVLPGGTVTIAAGATRAEFTVDVPQGALGASSSANLQVAVTGDSNNDSIFAPTAQTSILSSTPVAGPPAQPQFAELSGGGALTHAGHAYTLTLAPVAQGSTQTVQLAILNAAAPGADELTGLIGDSGTGSSTVAGDGGLPLIAAGGSYQGLRVSLGAATTGAQSETIVLKPTDANPTGYAAPLPDETFTIKYSVAPTVAVSIASSAITFANPAATVNFAFSSAPVNFTLDGVSATGGALSNLTGAGKSYSATFTALIGIDIADASVSVEAGSWSDSSGVAGFGASTSPFTVDTRAPAVAPAIAGTLANQATTFETALAPFAHVVVSDANANATDTLTITLSGGGGSLSGAGLQGSGATYTLQGTAGEITAEIEALAFTPAVGQPDTTSTTSFTLSDLSSAYPSAAVDATTSVVDSDPAVSVGYFLAHRAQLDAMANGFDILDSAGNVPDGLDALNGDTHLVAIALSDGGTQALRLTIAEALNDGTALAKITGPHTVSLALQGAGTFNLAAPVALVKVQTVAAQEGQAAYASGGRTFAAQNQVIYLRDGTSLTVNVSADPTFNAANPKPATITIVGANNSDTINLASGNDVVTLGGPHETVNLGSGNNTINATAATIGATLGNGTGKNTLNVSGGGTMAMGSNIADISNVLLASSTTAYAFTANGISGLTVTDASTSTADRLIAGGAHQTLTGGGAGKVAFTGSSAGYDTFKDTMALFNRDTIAGFGDNGDVIDLIDLNPANAKLSWSQSGRTGTLTVTDKVTHNSTAITLVDLLNPYSVNAFYTGADPAGTGTAITYHATLLATPTA